MLDVSSALEGLCIQQASVPRYFTVRWGIVGHFCLRLFALEKGKGLLIFLPKG